MNKIAVLKIDSYICLKLNIICIIAEEEVSFE